MLSKDTVQHIARLARLTLSESEAAAYSTQLSAILDNFNEISKVDTSGVEPLVTPTEITDSLRADVVQAHGTASSSEDLLQNAPEKTGNLFKVPPVV